MRTIHRESIWRTAELLKTADPWYQRFEAGLMPIRVLSIDAAASCPVGIDRGAKKEPPPQSSLVGGRALRRAGKTMDGAAIRRRLSAPAGAASDWFGKMLRQCQRILLFCSFAAAVGCHQEATPISAPGQKEPPQGASVPTPAPLSAVPSAATATPPLQLTVVVVDDAPLTAGLKLLRGEWAERHGSLMQLREWTVEELLTAKQLPADLILYPSRYVGTLVDRDWLRPLRNSVLRNPDLALEDVFPLVRNVTSRYGNQVYSLSLGEPPLMLAIGALEAPLETRPLSWEAVAVPLVTNNSPLQQPRAAELLARGIAFGKHRSQSIDWFDVESMQPRITSPPFRKALQQMLENQQAAAKQPGSHLALAWPTTLAFAGLALPSHPLTDSNRDAAVATAYVPLPVASQVFNPLREIWEVNEAPEPLVCLGFAGRSASVTRGTRNSASAFKLLTWLISESIASQLSPRSAATVWSRSSQVTQADKWLAGSVAGDETVAAVTGQLSSECYYLLPRIPGVDEYLQVMDDALAAAFLEGLPVEETLESISSQWNTLTDRYGRNRQRGAYRKHLGISEE